MVQIVDADVEIASAELLQEFGFDGITLFRNDLKGSFETEFFVDVHKRRAKHFARNILDVKPDDYAHVARGAHKIAAAAMKAFKADGITVQQFNEPAGGQVVFHLHMHVMPRHDGVALLPPASRKEDVKVLEDNATKLIAALG